MSGRRCWSAPCASGSGAPGRRRVHGRGRRPPRVRDDGAPDGAGERARGRGAGRRAAPELRGWGRPPAADPGEVPGRPWPAARLRLGAVRRDAPRFGHRPHAPAAGHATSTGTPAGWPSCSTPHGWARRSTSSGWRSRRASASSTSASPPSRRRPRRAARSGPVRPPRAPTSRASSETCWGRSRAARGTSSTRPATSTGDVLRSRKGDYLVTLDPRQTQRRGPPHRRRVQGPRHLRQADARRAGGGAPEPQRRGRPGRLHAAARAGGHRPVRRATG